MKNDIQTSKKNYDLFTATNKPNPKDEDKEALRKYFAESPEICLEIADLSNRVQNQLLETLADSFLVRESYKVKLAAMRDNLGWNGSSEIEKILIKQVCLNWLRLNYIESVHLSKKTESHSHDSGIYWEKRLSSAQKRYLRACESLAKVRKLLAKAELREQQAQNKRSKSTMIAQQILKNATTYNE